MDAIAGGPPIRVRYLGTMRPFYFILVLLTACSRPDDTLCKRFFEPYPDMVSQRERNKANAPLIDAMAAYNQKDYATAAVGLRAIIDKNEFDHTARMYLVSALIGSGQPYKAEMQLDFLENTKDQSYRDQVDWYNALCWLCTGQYERAMHQAIWIADQPAHTYKEQAHQLALTLTDH